MRLPPWSSSLLCIAALRRWIKCATRHAAVQALSSNSRLILKGLTACQVAHTIERMNTPEIKAHLDGINVTEFSQRHKLPLRTLMRIKAGGSPTSATAKVVGDAIKKDEKKAKSATKGKK